MAPPWSEELSARSPWAPQLSCLRLPSKLEPRRPVRPPQQQRPRLKQRPLLRPRPLLKQIYQERFQQRRPQQKLLQPHRPSLSTWRWPKETGGLP